ncbi:hypothetical protein GCM10008024_08660 [Allgaiera indica]|uniref:Uncharacterized protein n=1 Tax=Allgaiera indica TaxID=765699 RepID=A0AAN4ZYA9_9RHOB|nr:hypothetical protein [Allgaiera indica]GHD99786.1 hypothetical protein GCM10008024_08660 [Allgaiera indica]SDW18306.1 hypothetical protein SAMN05444006_10210 [Allgaiera indica]
MFDEKIPATFVQYATDILADTNSGLSGSNIVKETAAYAVEYDVNIPHQTYPFDAPNKRTALFENLQAFSGPQQYRIIKELCDHRSFAPTGNKKRDDLKIRLVTRYQQFAGEAVGADINETLIEETKHWLDQHPGALASYNSALQKYDGGVFLRNLLDDLRLSLESLLKSILGNDKSLENQLSALGKFITDNGGSKELSNMFVKLLDYYAKYQNSYVKHNDGVIEEEIEFIFEITSSFMKHLIRIGKSA